MDTWTLIDRVYLIVQFRRPILKFIIDMCDKIGLPLFHNSVLQTRESSLYPAVVNESSLEKLPVYRELPVLLEIPNWNWSGANGASFLPITKIYTKKNLAQIQINFVVAFSFRSIICIWPFRTSLRLAYFWQKSDNWRFVGPVR